MGIPEPVLDKFFKCVQLIDYQLFLPTISRLPLGVGRPLAILRGCLHFLFNLDWRSICLKKPYVRQRTFAAIKVLRPGKRAWTLHVKTLQRFMTNSREEYEAAMFLHRDMAFLKSCSRVEGLQPLLEAQKSGVGIMLLTPHFDSYTTGIILMGLHWLCLNVMTTAMLRDPQVYPGIQAFFKNKIAGLERYMNGGSIRDYETATRFFYQTLRKGEAVVIAADVPSPSESSYLDVNFLGKRRKMAMGVTRIAEQTGSFICAFACLYKGGGRYHLVFSPLYETGKGKSRASIDRVYEFINQKIDRYPERWWASDLMAAYEEIA